MKLYGTYNIEICLVRNKQVTFLDAEVKPHIFVDDYRGNQYWLNLRRKDLNKPVKNYICMICSKKKCKKGCKFEPDSTFKI